MSTRLEVSWRQRVGHGRRAAVLASLFLLGGLVACEPVPVHWAGEETETAMPLRSASEDRAVLAAPPLDSLRCEGSLRSVATVQGRRIAVWWSRRAVPAGTAPAGAPSTSQVRLLAAWQDTTARPALAWEAPLAIDTLDQGPADAQAVERGDFGCARPAPSVAVDSVNGFVHVTYALRGPEGTGIFYAHQMDPRAAFEMPVAILYGERLGASAVASDGDVVAVAYEDPNGRTRASVGVAVSITAGHLFAQRLAATDGARAASSPDVAVRGRAVTVGWRDPSAAAGQPEYRMRRAQVEP